MTSIGTEQHASLRPVCTSDLPTISALLNRCGKLGIPRASTSTESMIRLRDLMDHSALEFFTVESDDTCVGCAYAYDYRPADSHCKASIVSFEMNRNAWIDVAREFTNYLLERYPLHKIFCETVDEEEVSRWQSVGFAVEARINQHRYIQGEYRDLVILSRGRQ